MQSAAGVIAVPHVPPPRNLVGQAPEIPDVPGIDAPDPQEEAAMYCLGLHRKVRQVFQGKEREVACPREQITVAGVSIPMEIYRRRDPGDPSSPLVPDCQRQMLSRRQLDAIEQKLATRAFRDGNIVDYTRSSIPGTRPPRPEPGDILFKAYVWIVPENKWNGQADTTSEREARLQQALQSSEAERQALLDAQARARDQIAALQAEVEQARRERQAEQAEVQQGAQASEDEARRNKKVSRGPSMRDG